MSERPNILLIMADQLRLDSLGCYGHPVVQTPNIDRLAATGVRFDSMFAAYPVCAPNRASIATGRYPSVHRLRSNGMRLPRSEQTLMETLRLAGYRTYGSGKMHFGPQWQFPADGSPISDPPPETAFDPQPGEDEFPWYGFEKVMLTEDHRTGPYGRYLAQHGYHVWDEKHSAAYPQHATEASAFPEEHHQTTWITDRATEYLKEAPSGQPFFLWTSYVHPHHPFNPPVPYDTMYDPADMPLPVWDESEPDRWPRAYREKYFARSGGHEAVGMCDQTDDDWRRIRAYYYGMISQIDENIGRLLATLEQQGQADKTLIVFTSDHGENLGDHRLLFKRTTYDCITRVPFIATFPGRLQPGVTRDHLVSSVDIMPTILNLVDVEPPVPSPIQGQSLLPCIEDDATPGREAVLIENELPWRSVRTRDALLTWHGEGEVGELYDLTSDPDCLRNLWAEADALPLRAAMVERLVSLMAQNVDPLPAKEGPW